MHHFDSFINDKKASSGSLRLHLAERGGDGTDRGSEGGKIIFRVGIYNGRVGACEFKNSI